MSRAFARLAQVVRVVETGALEIRTPDDDDPALVTALQLDGDIVCSIHTRRFGDACHVGWDTLDEVGGAPY